jgi:hypothetical protein
MTVDDNDDVYHLPEVVLRLSKSIRHCEVVDKSGSIIAGKSREDLQFLVTDENGHRQALEAAMRHFRTPSWARNLGKMYYNASRYEKIIGAVIPLAERHLLLLSFDHDTNEFDKIIMKKILPLIKRISSRL